MAGGFELHSSAGRLSVLGLCVGAGLTAIPVTLQAQLSPKCERNGRPDFCAYTPPAASVPGGIDAGRLVFADDSVYGLQRDEASCRDDGFIRICKAWILHPPSSDHPIAASYRGTAYEGGYRHEYVSRPWRLTYTYLD